MNQVLNWALGFRSMETLASKAASIKHFGRKCIEHRETWGNDYPDKTFYVIRRPSLWGIMSILTVYIVHINYAIRRGYIPVIDMQNTESLYLEKNEIGGDKNAWEYYFEQPAGFDLNTISHAKNIVVSGLLLYPNTENNFPIDINTLTDVSYRKWHMLGEQYFHLNNQTKSHIAQVYRDLFNPEKNHDKVCGVYCRGTDYSDLHPKDHPIQPSVDQVIEKTEEIINTYHMDGIYLVTEDERVLNQFKQKFSSEKLLYIDCVRYNAPQNADDYIWKRKSDRPNNKYLSGLEYLTGMLLLTKCNALLGGVTGGTTGLYLLDPDNYEYKYYWDLGRY